MTNRLEQHAQHTRVRMDQEQEVRGTEAGRNQSRTRRHQRRCRTSMCSFCVSGRKTINEDGAQVVESTLAPPLLPQQPSLLPACVLCCLYLLLVLSTLVFQLFCLFNPPEATITIIPRSQTVNMTGTVQLGILLLQPLTISQSRTVLTTGMGHQNARSAIGTLTFYNGQFRQSRSLPAPSSAERVASQWVIDQEAVVPAGNPPSYGQVSVPAHAETSGSSGNILAYDINHACCATSVLVTNVQPFTGGRDARDFRETVARRDITTAATPLTSAVVQSVNGAFQAQLQPQEQVAILPCSSHRDQRSPDRGGGITGYRHSIESCRAVAYNGQQLATHVTDVLIHHATAQLQAGYSLFGSVRASVTMAAVSDTTHPQVFLAFKAQGTWVLRPLEACAGADRTSASRQDDTRGRAALGSVTRSGASQHSLLRVRRWGRLPKQDGLIHLAFLVASCGCAS